MALGCSPFNDLLIAIFFIYVSWNFLKINSYKNKKNDDDILSTCGLLSSMNLYFFLFFPHVEPYPILVIFYSFYLKYFLHKPNLSWISLTLTVYNNFASRIKFGSHVATCFNLNCMNIKDSCSLVATLHGLTINLFNIPLVNSSSILNSTIIFQWSPLCLVWRWSYIRSWFPTTKEGKLSSLTILSI